MVKRSLSLAILILALLGAGFLWFAANLPTAPEQPEQRTDAIVVLTGGAERVAEGLHLLASGKAKMLLVSGVHPDVTVGELLAQAPDVPASLADRIVLGYAAGDTEGNAAETAEWMTAEGFTSLRLVTAAYHMPRSLLEFQRALPGATIVAHPVFPPGVKQEGWWNDAGSTGVLVGEYLKYLLALISGPFRHTS